MNAIIVYLPRGDKKVIIPSGRRYSINSKGSLRWPTPSTTSPPPFCGKRLNLGGLEKKKGEGRSLVGFVRMLIMQLYRWLGGEGGEKAVLKMKFLGETTLYKYQGVSVGLLEE